MYFKYQNTKCHHQSTEWKYAIFQLSCPMGKRIVRGDNSVHVLIPTVNLYFKFFDRQFKSVTSFQEYIQG